MTPLEEQIAAEIRRRGPLTFRRFMELALYHPEHGYYQRPRDPFGAGGDFYTNSQLQPVFGRLLAQQIQQWYREMGAPPDFTVIEMGPAALQQAPRYKGVCPRRDVSLLMSRAGSCRRDFRAPSSATNSSTRCRSTRSSGEATLSWNTMLL